MKILTTLAMTMMLIACGAEESVEDERTVGNDVADHYNRQLDNARAVEDQVMEQKQRIDEALEEADDN